MSRAGSAALVAAALGLFLASWSLLHHGTFARGQITDTGLYEYYGDAMAHGRFRTATFGSSTHPARCRCSCCRRSATRATATRTTAGSTA